MRLLKVKEDLYQVKRAMNASYFNGSNNPKKLVGMWVDHLDCDRVIQDNNKYLFCQLIEEAEVI